MLFIWFWVEVQERVVNMESVVYFIIDRFGSIFLLFSKFEMFGITLFEFLVSIMIIGIMIPILLSLSSNTLGSSSRYYRNEVRKAERRKL